MSMAIANFLTTADAAEELGISESRVRQFVMDGRLAPTRRIGNMLLFDRKTVREFAKIPRQPGPAKKAG
jgi:excisionase family DNA binding protein